MRHSPRLTSLMAVPDRLIGKIAHSIVEKVRPRDGADRARRRRTACGRDAGSAGPHLLCDPSLPPADLQRRDDRGREEGFLRRDRSQQHIVCALMQGPGGPLLRTLRGGGAHDLQAGDGSTPLHGRADRNPGAGALGDGYYHVHRLGEATDEAARRGVPRQAAVDFMLGHLTIGLSIAFEIFPEGRFSDGALHAIEQAKPQIFREGWLERVFAPKPCSSRSKTSATRRARAGSYGAEPA